MARVSIPLYEAYMEEVAKLAGGIFARRHIKTELIEALALRTAVR